MLRSALALVLLTSLSISCKNSADEISSDPSEISSVSGACLTLDTNQIPSKKSLTSFVTSKIPTNYRGRDIVTAAGKSIPIDAKFAYLLGDRDLTGANVDIYLSLDCTSKFTFMGSATTASEAGDHGVSAVLGQDPGGRIHTSIPPLPIGRHKVTMVYTDNNTTTDLYVTVLPEGQKIVVSDIDGTLTTSEYAAATEVVNLPAGVNKGSPEVMRYFHENGYFIYYLTARPEFLMNKTRDWLTKNGYPAGALRTTATLIGAVGQAATDYKVSELQDLKQRSGLVPAVAFGNKPSDVAAFAAAGIAPSGSYYFKLGADPQGGTDFADYGELLTSLQKSVSH